MAGGQVMQEPTSLAAPSGPGHLPQLERGGVLFPATLPTPRGLAYPPRKSPPSPLPMPPVACAPSKMATRDEAMCPGGSSPLPHPQVLQDENNNSNSSRHLRNAH